MLRVACRSTGSTTASCFRRCISPNDTGLLALGGDLRPERLILAYAKGIFPGVRREPSDLVALARSAHGDDPTRDLVIQRSLRKQIQRKPYQLTMDSAFEQVLAGCATQPRAPASRARG